VLLPFSVLFYLLFSTCDTILHCRYDVDYFVAPRMSVSGEEVSTSRYH
jgi:hypothetical protein